MTVKKMIGLVVGTLMAVTMLSALPSTAAATQPRNDFPRLPNECATFAEQIPQKFIFCRINEFRADRPTVLVWGDSHAFMMVPAVKRAVASQDVNLVAFVLGSCPPVRSGAKGRAQKQQRTGCERAGDMVFRQVKKLNRTEHKPKVIIGINWDIYLTALDRAKRGQPAYNAYVASTANSFRRGTPRLFKSLGRQGVDVDVVAPVGQVPANARRCKRGNNPYRCSLPRERVLHKEKPRMRYAQRMTRQLAGNPELIDVNGELCSRLRCRGVNRGVLTWYDDLHISATMAKRRMATYFRNSVVDALNQPEPRRRESADPGGCGLRLLC